MKPIDTDLVELARQVKGKFPKGESVDVPKYLEEHGNPEAAKVWVEMNDEYGDLLKKSSGQQAREELNELAAGWESGHRIKEELPEGQGSLLPGMEPEIKMAKTIGDVRNLLASRFPPKAEDFNRIKDPDGFWKWDIRDAEIMSGIKYRGSTGRDIGDVIFWLNMVAAAWERIMKKKGSEKTSNQIAKTILEQMGGQRRLQTMLGADTFVAHPKGVSFRWPNPRRSKGNMVEVKLTSMDLYDVTFYNASKSGGIPKVKPVKKYTHLYADQLVKIFEKQTGWYLRMASDSELEARFEEGVPADPTENMSPEDKKKWQKQKELHKDEFKTAMGELEYEIQMDSDLAKLSELTKVAARPLNEIAQDIRKDWGSKVNYAAKPYLQAMMGLRNINDNYGYDSGASVVAYFLSNASSWRGPTAKAIKLELKKMLKGAKRASDDEIEARFEEGKPADPTENMSKEDAKKWRLENLKNRDNFTDKKAGNSNEDIDTAFKQLSEALKKTALPTADGKYRTRVEPSEFMLEGSTENEWDFKHQATLNLLIVNKENGQIKIPTGDKEDLGGSFDKIAASIKSYHALDNKVDMTKVAKVLHMKLARPLAIQGYSTSWTMTNKTLEVQVSFEKTGKVNLYILPSISISNTQEALFEKERMVIRDIKQLASLVAKAVMQTMTNPLLTHYQMEGKQAAQTPSGLYGYTRKIQGDCETCIRKTTKTASKLAKMAWQKDNAVAPFLIAHAKRSDSLPAKILVEAMKSVGPKVASKDIKGRRNGLYGFRPNTASLGMKMCNSLRVEVGHFASDLHKRRSEHHANITGFLKQHMKETKCMYSRMLHASYPDAPTLKKASEPKSVQDWLELKL